MRTSDCARRIAPDRILWTRSSFLRPVARVSRCKPLAALNARPFANAQNLAVANETSARLRDGAEFKSREDMRARLTRDDRMANA